MRWASVWVVPGAVSPIDQFLGTYVPALKFCQDVRPTVGLPTPDAGPKVANLLLTRVPHFLQVMEALFDTPS